MFVSSMADKKDQLTVSLFICLISYLVCQELMTGYKPEKSRSIAVFEFKGVTKAKIIRFSYEE